MEFVIAFVVVVVLVGLFGAGVASGTAANPPTIGGPDGTVSTTEITCQEACARWDNARQMQCNAKTDEAAARSRADALRNQMLALIAAAASLAIGGGAAVAAAAVATATIFGIPAGLVLTGIAVGLFIASAAATAAAAVLAGQLQAAEFDASNKAAARRSWDKEVADARASVNAVCSLEQANACLSRTGPC